MSEEQLKAFLEAVKADAGLQEKLKAAENVDAVVEIAKAAGFRMISAEDLKKRAQADLSDEELEGVAGGVLELEGVAGCYVGEGRTAKGGWTLLPLG
jgi:predicted ribosomally synthesized peptide with nif11-like leader